MRYVLLGKFITKISFLLQRQIYKRIQVAMITTGLFPNDIKSAKVSLYYQNCIVLEQSLMGQHQNASDIVENLFRVIHTHNVVWD